MGPSALRHAVEAQEEIDLEAGPEAAHGPVVDHLGVSERFGSSFTKDQAASCFSRSAFI